MRNLLEHLFQKKPEDRLGYGPKAAQKVKNHVWFEKVNWNAILNKELMAPFVPILNGPCDTRNFDPEFTNLNFDDSFKENSLA